MTQSYVALAFLLLLPQSVRHLLLVARTGGCFFVSTPPRHGRAVTLYYPSREPLGWHGRQRMMDALVDARCISLLGKQDSHVRHAVAQTCRSESKTTPTMTMTILTTVTSAGEAQSHPSGPPCSDQATRESLFVSAFWCPSCFRAACMSLSRRMACGMCHSRQIQC